MSNGIILPRHRKLMDAAKKQTQAPKEEPETGKRDLLEASKATLAALVAAVSLLKRGSKKAAPSDTMFDIMIADYEKAIEAGRAAIAKAEDRP